MKAGRLERFMARVAVCEPDSCWPWTGSRNFYGYGVFCDGRRFIASRVSYELHKGKISSGLLVCHTCDNPSCVNPSHLFLGTVRENAQDMSRKGRAWRQQETHCVNGHLYSPDNTYRRPSGRRECRICKQTRMREFTQRARDEAAAKKGREAQATAKLAKVAK